MNKNTFQFLGTGLGCLWLTIWTSVITFITLGLYAPWGYCLVKCWETDNIVFEDELSGQNR